MRPLMRTLIIMIGRENYVLFVYLLYVYMAQPIRKCNVSDHLTFFSLHYQEYLVPRPTRPYFQSGEGNDGLRKTTSSPKQTGKLYRCVFPGGIDRRHGSTSNRGMTFTCVDVEVPIRLHTTTRSRWVFLQTRLSTCPLHSHHPHHPPLRLRQPPLRRRQGTPPKIYPSTPTTGSPSQTSVRLCTHRSPLLVISSLCPL